MIQRKTNQSIGRRVETAFYSRDPAVVAQDLIGKRLIRFPSVADAGVRAIGGIIVETEAYLDRDDPASHSARGLTKSNASMFSAPGTLYVYPIHSRHCLNVATSADGIGCAVLIRAIEPVWGIQWMGRRRSIGATVAMPSGTQPPLDQWSRSQWRRLTSGPGMICQALDVDRTLDGISVTDDPRMGIFHASDDQDPLAITISRSPRIGVSKAAELPLRFFADGNLFVSGRAGDHAAARQNRFFGPSSGKSPA